MDDFIFDITFLHSKSSLFLGLCDSFPAYEVYSLFGWVCPPNEICLDFINVLGSFGGKANILHNIGRDASKGSFWINVKVFNLKKIRWINVKIDHIFYLFLFKENWRPFVGKKSSICFWAKMYRIFFFLKKIF